VARVHLFPPHLAPVSRKSLNTDLEGSEFRYNLKSPRLILRKIIVL